MWTNICGLFISFPLFSFNLLVLDISFGVSYLCCTCVISLSYLYHVKIFRSCLYHNVVPISVPIYMSMFTRTEEAHFGIFFLKEIFTLTKLYRQKVASLHWTLSAFLVSQKTATWKFCIHLNLKLKLRMLHFPMGAIRLKMMKLFPIRLWELSNIPFILFAKLAFLAISILSWTYAHKNTQSNTANLMEYNMFPWSPKSKFIKI